MIAAIAGEREITVADVDAREALLRSGPLAHRLPDPRAPEGRNLRRWLVQVMAGEAVAAREATRRGLVPSGQVMPLRMDAAMRGGGVAAAVLSISPYARALRAHLAPPVDEAAAVDYYTRNLDRYTRPETRWVRPFGPVRRGELAGPIEAAVFAADLGATVGPVDGPGGPWTLVVERIDPGGPEPYAAVRRAILAALAEEGADRAFSRWLETSCAEQVRLMPGYEHPGDPRQPDATHRH
ncbi:peptidyl-prolyl cis-trans isomerase [Streptosporangiaceae bacterium NEAU-GS5]|nr:peptidyl-prolyl cis-trans isomerase [Streptosporangiaceae bacterium NEAU-GS5]